MDGPRSRRPSTSFGAVDPALVAAARRVIEGNLALHAGETLAVVADRANVSVAEALCEAARSIRAEARLTYLEDSGPRPHAKLSDRVRATLTGASASVFVADVVRDEKRMRAELVTLACATKLRHAHMLGVPRAALLAGLTVEPQRLSSLARALLRRLTPTSTLRVRSALGTDLTIRCAVARPWIELSGALRPGEPGNVPSGEVLSTQDDIHGTYVADGTLGDVDGEMGARLGAAPITFRIEQGKIVNVQSRDSARVARLHQKLREMVNLDRVGLVVLGTNVGVTEPTGTVIVDQKMPGVHLSFGYTMRDRTRASWDAQGWICATATGTDLDVDGQPVLRSGRYLFTS